MHLAFGGDHAGFVLKQPLVRYVSIHGHKVVDLGGQAGEQVDFPDITRQVCAEVIERRAERAILICGSGVGAVMAANRIPGIRAAVCHDAWSARQSVEHDDANVLCLGSQIIGEQLAYELVRIWLAARFLNEEPYLRRVRKLTDMESPPLASVNVPPTLSTPPSRDDREAVAAAMSGERTLLDPAVHQSASTLAVLLDPEFVVYASSGRRWTREDILRVLPATLDGNPAARLSALAMTGRVLAPGLVLVTYISEDAGQRARRASLWRFSHGAWRLLFHQGTPVPV